jgi:hypothetical protein
MEEETATAEHTLRMPFNDFLAWFGRETLHWTACRNTADPSDDHRTLGGRSGRTVSAAPTSADLRPGQHEPAHAHESPHQP